MPLFPGSPAPLFSAPSPVNPRFAFGSVGGRYVLLGFLPQPGPERDAALALIAANADLFSDERLLFFGVLPDEASFAQAQDVPPTRWFGDATGDLARKYALVDAEGARQPHWVLIDPTLRILAQFPLEQGATMIAGLKTLGDPDAHARTPMHAPVLIVPRVFEPALCQQLMAYYRELGGTPSGVMREIGGKTVGVFDNFKRRRDVNVVDETLKNATRVRIANRLLPEITKAFQFEATRMERYLVACYGAEDGGYFRPHRDNTTPGTAHRRFAVSINLNAEDFDGGDLRFPEFGRKTYRPPTGGAVVFSCSLLHEATPVTRGERYAFLPFLYDEAGARIRDANLHSLDLAPQAAHEAAEPVTVA